MRSAVILIVVFVALIGGFALFMLTQGTTKEYKVQTINRPTTLPRPVPATQGDAKLGAGNEVWIQGFNKKSGELTNEFRADRYDPPVGNKVHVIHPDSRFYENNGTVMTITADYGDMVMAEGAKKPGQMEAISNQPPQNGIMHNVTLGLLENAEATVPIMTAKLPIMAFDNDTMRMNTIDWPKDDQIIPADQVPVVVRGRDYDFDGQGLILRYNQRDQRLEFLQVAHGRRLLIKNTAAFSNNPAATQPTPLTQTGLALPLQMDDRPIELVDADPDTGPKLSAQEKEQRHIRHEAATRAATRPVKRVGGKPVKPVPATKPATTKPVREAVAYRAHFEDNVHIKEGDAPIGQADQMFTTFVSGQQKSMTQPTTQSATQPGTATPLAGAIPVPSMPAAAPVPAGSTTTPHHATTRPTHPVVAQTPAGTASTDATPDTQPTTQPSQPIEITWTGKLTVEPEPLADSELRSATDRIVEFFGHPAHLEREGASVDAAYVWAGVEGDRFRALGNAKLPTVFLKNKDGSTLLTRSVISDGENVVIRGQSVAESFVAQQVDATQPATQRSAPPQKIVTHWDNIGTLHLFTPEGGGAKTVDHAVFKGHVDVMHPQLHLMGDTLALGFISEAGKDQPTLKTVHVDGHVNAAVTGQDNTVQTITSHVLDLATASQDGGGLTIKQMHAVGDVVAQDPNQKLLTDDLVAFLSPNTADQSNNGQSDNTVNKINIDHMTATGNVHFNSLGDNADNGNAATADTLKIDRQDDIQLITLTGAPATVQNAQSHVTGNLIKLDSNGDHASVGGPGTLEGVSQQADSSTAQPVYIKWAESMNYDGKDNRAKIVKDVVVRTRGSDGAFDQATGQVMDITLADAPATTQPTTQEAATQAAPVTVATSQPSSTQPAGLDALAASKKAIKSITLSNPTPTNDGVEVSSLLYGPDDATKWIKRTHLFAPLVIVDTNPDGSLGTVTIPSAGRMLTEDRSDAAAAPVPTGKKGAAPATQPASSKGTMAMEWKKQLIYNPNDHSALLEGSVVVVHQAPGQDMMRMLAPRLIAQLDDTPGAASQIKTVTADQGATMLNKTVRIDAASAVYEPGNDRMIAQGTPRQPVQLFDETGLSSGSFSELWWNMKTNMPERMVNFTAHLNRVLPPGQQDNNGPNSP